MFSLPDLLCPEACAGCGRPARGGVCLDCLERVPRLGAEGCRRCGRPGKRAAADCVDCRGRDLRFDVARQAVPFAPVVRSAVHRLKYSGCRPLVVALADLLEPVVRPFAKDPELVTWIAPDPVRLRRSGVDHGRLLAGEVGRRLCLPVEPALHRVRATRRQMELEPDRRRTNLAGAFRASTVPPWSVLVVDDVFTTGSTASEAARALKVGGARRVAVAAVARSFLPDSRIYN